MGQKLTGRVVWLIAGVIVIGSIVQIVLGIEASEGFLPNAGRIGWGLLPAAYAITAGLIVRHQPRNAVGWLLLVPAAGSFLDFVLVDHYLDRLVDAPAEIGLGTVAVLSYNGFSWLLLIFPVFHLLLVFPNGSLISGRWRIIVSLEILMITFLVSFITFGREIGPFDERWVVDNPVGFLPSVAGFEGLFLPIWTLGLVVVTIAGVTSMVLRFRRSGTEERHQIKWLLYAVGLFGVVYSYSAISTDFSEGGIEDLVLSLSLIGIPVAIAIAVLRYKLFEIDRVISRTVGYILVVGVLGLVYTGGAVWLPSLISGESPVFVALATLAAAAIFNPTRRRIIHAVDRRFYRARYDAEAVVDSLKVHLRDQTDIELLAAEWVSVVSDTMHPSSVGVWVKQR